MTKSNLSKVIPTKRWQPFCGYKEKPIGTSSFANGIISIELDLTTKNGRFWYNYMKQLNEDKS